MRKNMKNLRKLLRQLRMVGGIDRYSGTVFLSIGDWFQVLGGAPDRHSVYVRLFSQEIRK